MQIEKFSPHSNAQSPPVRRNDIIFYKIQTASYNLFQLGAWDSDPPMTDGRLDGSCDTIVTNKTTATKTQLIAICLSYTK